MTCNSITEFKALSNLEQDEFLRQYWKTEDFVFYGEFVPEIAEKERRSGIIQNIKAPGSANFIKYPFSDTLVSIVVPITKKLGKGYYQFKCRQTSGRLQALLKTCKKISGQIYNQNFNQGDDHYIASTIKKDSRYLDLEDNMHGWGKHIHHLIGAYTLSKEGIPYLDNILTENLSKITEYPSPEDKKPMQLPHTIAGAEEGQLYSFSWKFSNDDDSNKYKITIDESKPLKPFTAKEVIDTLYNDAAQNDSRDSKEVLPNSVEVIKNEIVGQDPCTFIYELLQNASDYPYDDTVDVEIHLTHDYLIFRHSGMPFNGLNVLGLCNVGGGEKSKKKETIGYKGIGFKNVFIENDYVYIKSKDFSFSFDEKNTGARYTTTPRWVNEDSIDEEVKSILSKDSDKYRVNIVLKPRRKEVLFNSENNFRDRLHKVFDNIRQIIFISRIQKVLVYIDGEEPIICSRNQEDSGWYMSKVYSTEVSEDIRMKLNEEIVNKTGRAPQKFYNKQDTGASFACLCDGNELKPVDKANIYCYLPTQVQWGFPFLINTDMIPTGPRDGIVKTEFWNLDYAEYAGELFFYWLKDLVIEHKFNYASIFSLVPDFAHCIEVSTNGGYEDFIKRFQKGFENKFLNEAIFPTEDGSIITIDKLIYDKILLTQNEAVFTDKFFYETSDLKGYYLPAKELRCGSFNQLIKRYESHIKAFVYEESLYLRVEKEAFQNWIKNPDNNKKYLRFLISKDLILNFKDKKIFISEDGNVSTASALYYNVEEECNALPFLKVYLPSLSSESRKFLESFTAKWNENGISMFKPFSVGTFVQYTLLSSDNIKDVIAKLSIEDNSLKFFNFLGSKEVDFVPELKTLPFFDEEDNCVSDFNKGFIFFESKEGEKVKKASWMNSEWIHFVTSKYSEAAKEYMSANLGVEDYNSGIVASDIILGEEEYKNTICNKIQESFQINRDFVFYCYEQQTEFPDGSLCCYPLRTENFRTESTYEIFDSVSSEVEAKLNEEHPATTSNYYILTEDHVYFMNSQFRVLFGKGWIDQEWMFCLYLGYFNGLSDEEIMPLKKFFINKFGVKELDEKNFYFDVVRNHLPEIFKLTSGENDIDGENNFDFVSYLDDNYELIFKVEKDSDKFKDFILVDDSLHDIHDTKSVNTYIFDTELQDILQKIWLSNDLVNICSRKYASSRVLKELGAKEFDINSFFNDVLVNNIETIRKSLITFDNNKDFHNFIMNNSSRITPDAIKNITSRVPVFLMNKPDKPAPTSCNHRIQSSTTKELFEKGFISPEKLDLIDPRYDTGGEAGKNYWENLLGNKKFGVLDFLNWLKDNSVQFSKIIKDIHTNIDFWRWAKKNIVSNDNKKVLSCLPILQKGQNDMVCPSNSVVYVSNEYLDKNDKKREEFIKQFDASAFILSPSYIEKEAKEDDIRAWREFWIAVGVHYEIFEILKETVIKKLNELDNEEIPGLIAQYRDKLEEADSAFLSKMTSLRLKCTDGKFRPIKDVVYIDCFEKEPFKYISIPNSVNYRQKDSETRKLISDIATVAGTRVIRDLKSWEEAKINQYVELQNSSDVLPLYHYEFIDELASGYNENSSKWSDIEAIRKIKLLNKDNVLVDASNLTEGTVYRPYCDFESYAIEKEYLSPLYLEECKEKVQYLFRHVLKIKYNFTKEDIPILSDYNFAKYFWSEYISKKDNANVYNVKTLISNKDFDEVVCIPTCKEGLCECPKNLYSRNIARSVVKRFDGWEAKFPWEGINDYKFSEQGSSSLLEMLPFKDHLSFSDALAALFTIKGKDNLTANRPEILRWMITEDDGSHKDEVERARKDEHFCWKNGSGDDVQIKNLYALEGGSSSTLLQYFGRNKKIIDPLYLPTGDDFEKACNILGIKVIHNSKEDLQTDFVDKTDEADKYKSDFELYALIISGVESLEEWNTLFDGYKKKIDALHMWKCTSISLSYINDKESIYQNLKKFYHSEDDEDSNFYYVKKWDAKIVYSEFINRLTSYLGFNVDPDIVSNVFDTKESAIEYLNANSSLLNDKNYIIALSEYLPDILQKFNESKDGEEEDNSYIYRPTVINPMPTQEDEPYDNSEGDGNDEGYDEDNLNDNEDNSHTTDSEDSETIKGNEKNDDYREEGATSQAPKADDNHANGTSSSSDHSSYSQETGRAGSSNVGNGTQQRYSSSGHTRTNYTRSHHYNPENYDPDSFKPRSFQTGEQNPTQLGVSEISKEDVTRLSEILGHACNVDEIKDNNYLVRLRFYESAMRHGYQPKMDEKEFIENKHSELPTTNGYIHRCSARGGILYISPSIWNKLEDERCTICMYYGKKANEFLYIHNQQELMDMIDKDAIVIQVTGNDKREIINRVYDDKTLENMSGNIYTLIRTIKAQGDEFLFGDSNPEDKFNNDDDFDPDAEW